MLRLRWISCLTAWAVLFASDARAQTSALGAGGIVGIVKDATGAVLPGVTIEAASPVLIERVRAAVTDSSGHYRIVDLRPGAYSVTFTLPGFARHLREPIDVEGTSVVTVNIEMSIGSLDETVTVAAESSVVDVRSTARQSVVSQDALDRLPTSRYFYSLAVLLPGVVSSTRDVGGAAGNEFLTSLTAHGGRPQDQRVTVSGLQIGNVSFQQISNVVPNAEATQEVVIETAASDAERQTGGVSVNFVPRDGGNTLRGTLFVTGADGRWQATNLTQDLIDQGAQQSPTVLETTFDFNPSIGGPIVRDRLWFQYTFRRQIARNLTNMFYNVNAFQPNIWTYTPDPLRKARSQDSRWTDHQLRVTWQATPRNKIAISIGDQVKCECPGNITPTRAPEAGTDDRNPLQRTYQTEWRSPLTNRLIAEVVGQKRQIDQGFMELSQESSGVSEGAFAAARQMIGVTINNGAGIVPNQFLYHGPGPHTVQSLNAGGPFNFTRRPAYAYRGTLTALTGRHTIKVGVHDTFGHAAQETYTTTLDPFGRPVRYTFSTPNTPLSVTVLQGTLEAKAFQRDDLDHDFGVYAQDRWMMNRLTVNLGVRLDWFKSSYAEQTIPATAFGRPETTFAAGESLNWKDVTPRMAASYDLRGDGRTALKVTLNKYMQGIGLSGIPSAANPLNRGITQNFTRNWSDSVFPAGDPRRGNFVVDCDVFNPAANGECTNAIPAAVNNTTPTPLNDADLRSGWGLRPFNWELSAGLQREVLPRVSLDVSYFRRSWGNFAASDNLAVGPGDFVKYDLTVPVDHRLPSGGGYVLRGFQDFTSVAAATAIPNNRVVMVDELGATQIERWNGIDVTLKATPRNGLLVHAGTSTGRRHIDECDVWAVLPEVQGTQRSVDSCRATQPFRTQVKAMVAYTFPRFATLPAALARVIEDTQVAGTFQSIPGDAMGANYAMTNAEFARPCPSTVADTSCSTLGRFLTNQTQATNTRSIALLLRESVFDERQNQIDLRIGRIVRFGRTRASLNLDIYNALNASTVLARNMTLGQTTTPGSYAAAEERQADGGYNTLWVPTAILQARFLKISATIDF
jgi:hypothetical protein